MAGHGADAWELTVPGGAAAALAEAMLLWLWGTGAGVLAVGLLGWWLAPGAVIPVLLGWACSCAVWAVATRIRRAAAVRVRIVGDQAELTRSLGRLGLGAVRLPLRAVHSATPIAEGVRVVLRDGAVHELHLPTATADHRLRIARRIAAGPDPLASREWRALERQRRRVLEQVDCDRLKPR